MGRSGSHLGKLGESLNSAEALLKCLFLEGLQGSATRQVNQYIGHADEVRERGRMPNLKTGRRPNRAAPLPGYGPHPLPGYGPQ